MASNDFSNILGGIRSGNPYRRVPVVSAASVREFAQFSVRGNAPLSGNIRQAASQDSIPRLSMPHSVVSISKEEHGRIVKESGHRRANLPRFTIIESKISIYSFAGMQAVVEVNITNGMLDGNGLVNDIRMGPVNYNENCITCSQVNCPGHYGLITFPNPVYNPVYIRQVVYVLQLVCNTCGRLLATPEVLYDRGIGNLPHNKRLAAIADFSKKITECTNTRVSDSDIQVYPCSQNWQYITNNILESGEIFVRENERGGRRAESEVVALPIETVYGILNSILDVDKEILGFPDESHPRDLIMWGILVPPNRARTYYETGSYIQHDQLTELFATLAKKATNPNMGSSNELYQITKQLIFKSPNKSGSSSREIQSITPLIQGKSAIICKCMQGKRQDYSGRTVASGDPSLWIR